MYVALVRLVAADQRNRIVGVVWNGLPAKAEVSHPIPCCIFIMGQVVRRIDICCTVLPSANIIDGSRISCAV
jgi:hypothetical protein